MSEEMRRRVVERLKGWSAAYEAEVPKQLYDGEGAIPTCMHIRRMKRLLEWGQARSPEEVDALLRLTAFLASSHEGYAVREFVTYVVDEITRLETALEGGQSS